MINMHSASSCLQLPKYMWVDNFRTSANQLYSALPSLMKILEDATHVMRRIFDVIPDGHSLKGENASVANPTFSSKYNFLF